MDVPARHQTFVRKAYHLVMTMTNTKTYKKTKAKTQTNTNAKCLKDSCMLYFQKAGDSRISNITSCDDKYKANFSGVNILYM